MDLVKQVASEIKKNNWWRTGDKVVVAVSSGIDSMTLLDVLERLVNYRPVIIVAHVNHELRKASRTEEAYIRHYCKSHHLNLAVAHWPKAEHPQTGIENAARQFRYHFFKRVMKKYGASVVLTAHHLNDQAETILMRLIRGGALEELTGIHQVRSFSNGLLIRPLLRVPKLRIKKYATTHHLKWFTDETNNSMKITRNRIRHRLLPWMKKENPQILEHLNGYAIQIRNLILDNRSLNSRIVNELRTSFHDVWNLKPLFKYSRSSQLEILKALFNRFYPDELILPETVYELVQLINNPDKPQGKIDLGSKLFAYRQYDYLKIVNDPRLKGSDHDLKPFIVKLDHWYHLNDGLLMGCFTHNDFSHDPLILRKSRFNLTASSFPLKVRACYPGDKIRLRNGGHQKARRILIDQKVTDSERQNVQTLLTRNGYVLSILGYKESVVPSKHNSHKFLLIIKKGI